MIKEICAITVLANKLCMFVLLFSLARILGVELYGVFSYHYAIVTGIATVVGECLSVALSRYAVLNAEEVNYKTSLGLMLWGGIIVAALCVIVFLIFPAPASSYGMNPGYLLIGAFFLGFACVCNLTITGLMFSLNASGKWAVALAAHGLLGLLLVVSIAKITGQIEGVILTLAICTLIAPAYGFFTIKKNHFSHDDKGGRESSFFRQIAALLSRSGAPTIAGSMLLGAPVHIVCLMIFAKSSLNVSEVGYFSLFFLFYILVTVLPSSLTSYAIVKLAGRGKSASKLYLMLGLSISVCLPVFLVLSQSYWLCLLGSRFCSKNDLLAYAVLAGGIGLTTTIVTQILHSKNMTRVVFLGSCIYAFVYLLLTVVAGLKGNMLAVDLFRSFVFALAAQIAVLAVLGGRKLVQ
ncbi:oligosaccharide flippase family protein [Pseudomonas batumici]|uniref:oligosaccharide flippase family protein n=1 Tax=Pseudomonas batumici TaxID=226910 RepID=UPI00058A40F3|nr:oligosaccharide flippase family protein [Pseudomonas batumici]